MTKIQRVMLKHDKGLRFIRFKALMHYAIAKMAKNVRIDWQLYMLRFMASMLYAFTKSKIEEHDFHLEWNIDSQIFDVVSD